MIFCFTNINAQINEKYSYYGNHQKKELNTFKGDKLHGISIAWDSTGNKIAEVSFKDGLKDGKWKIWYENKQLAYEFHYKRGEKTGKWKSYDREGNLINIKDYENQTLHKSDN
jgi:antitoxin component YwqK of YwqJK toxin-antitoxin module